MECEVGLEQHFLETLTKHSSSFECDRVRACAVVVEFNVVVK